MGVGFLVFGLAGLLALICFMPVLAGRLHLPYSVMLAIVGMVLGLIIHVHGWAPSVMSDFLDSLQHFEVSSETFLFVFLPILLFETALSMNVRRLLDDIGPILMMAVVAVVVCTLAVGFSLDHVSDYGLVVCLLLGAIVATTDPVAVVGIFREVGAPKRLTTLVEGEALFNDAASISLYTVLLVMLATGGELSVGALFNSFLISFLGGGLAGLLMGRAGCWLFIWLRGWPAAEITLTLALAYLTFFISEHYLGVSGVVATVIAGLVVGTAGRTRMSPSTFEQLSGAWNQFGFWANSLIFIFAAMLIPRMMADATWMEALLVLVLFVVTFAARAVMVLGVLPLLGLTRFSTGVSRSYQAVMLWGGLRGAVSLALALAVTEQHNVPYEARQFIAVATTSFVLLTLFVNGLSLRPLIRWLKLDQPTQIERTLRNQVLAVALEGLRDKTEDVGKTERLDADARATVRAVFDAGLASLGEGQTRQFTHDERVAVGLAIVMAREEEMYFDRLKAQVMDWRIAENMLARAQRLGDMVRSGGLAEFEAAAHHDLRYARGLRLALRLYEYTGWQGWLKRELAQRFASLMAKRSVVNRLVQFVHEEVQPLVGSDVADEIARLQRRRLEEIERALQALALQYPAFSRWLQQAYLGRMARAMERLRYHDMLTQQLISAESYADLVSQLEQRWRHLEQRPSLDMAMGVNELVDGVPMFQALDEQTRRAIARLLRPRLFVPGQAIPMRVGRSPVMYFIASGAVALQLPDDTVAELGSGEIFGELLLVQRDSFEARPSSLGYSRLLMLQERDFQPLLERDPELRKKIEAVASQRLRALEVWRKYAADALNPPAASQG